MSADNWTKCPRCLKEARKQKAQQRQEAQEAYGKVSEDSYLLMVEDANAPIYVQETFREDYEIYITENGEFRVDYHGRCEKCLFKFEFKKEMQVTE